MKSFSELGLLAGIAVVAGLGNWLIGGKPSADPVMEIQELPLMEGEVLLAEVLEAGDAGLLWVDARPAEKWREDGLSGSINLTMKSDEPLGEQIIRHQDQLFGASRVVVYCGDVHCSMSHELAAKLKGEFRDLIAGEVLVLHGGMVALEAGGLLRNSSPDS